MLRRPAGPRASWVAQLGAVRRDFLGFLERCAAEHGDFFCIRPAPTTRIFVVNAPALVAEVLVTRAAEFGKSKQTRMMVGKYLGNGLVLSEGHEHAQQRRRVQSAFGPREVELAAPAIRQRAAAAATRLTTQRFELQSEMTELALRIITDILVGGAPDEGVDAGTLAGAATRREAAEAAFRDLAAAIGSRFRHLPLPDWVPTRRHRRDRAALARVHAVADALADTAAGGVAHRLAGEARLGRMTPAELRDQLVTLLFAGHETVAKVLTWTLFELARHPEIQERLRAELDAAGGDLDAAGLSRLPLLGEVIRESLRLYPPVWVFDRSPLEPLELGGHALTPKDTLYLSPYLMQRDPRHYPDPGAFRPGRPSSGTAAITFGAGKRVCIGQGLAMLEAQLVLASLLRGRRIELDGPADARPRPAATLEPDRPIWVRLTAAPRTGAATRQLVRPERCHDRNLVV